MFFLPQTLLSTKQQATSQFMTLTGRLAQLVALASCLTSNGPTLCAPYITILERIDTWCKILVEEVSSHKNPSTKRSNAFKTEMIIWQ